MNNLIKNRLLKLFFKRFLKVTSIFIFFIVFLFLCLEYNFLGLFGKIPNLEALEEPEVNITSELYTADTVLIGRYYTENRKPVPSDHIPEMMKKALIAVEDKRFYEHNGVDWKATLSIFYDFFTGEIRGASTITQQLAKNLFKTRSENTQGLLGKIPYVRMIVYKLKEWLTAIKLENIYNKNEIITMYLNTVDFGYKSFGIKTASRTFFKKAPSQLKTEEIAVLVGVLKATTFYSPVINPHNSKKRRNVVLKLMAQQDIITQEKCDSLQQLPLKLNFNFKAHETGKASYFRAKVKKFMHKWCKKNGYNLYSDGLKIYTTIDNTLQKYAEEAVYNHMRELQQKFDRHWKGRKPWINDKGKPIKGFIKDIARNTETFSNLKAKYDNMDTVWKIMKQPRSMKVFSWKGERDTVMSPMDSIRYYKRLLHAGFMLMDPKKGHVKAYVGGINHKHFKYDLVTQSKRQPGSIFKPFVYLAAIDSLGYTPCDKFVDSAITVHYKEKIDGKLVNKSWRPRNSDWKITGDSMTLRRAMGKSVNTITAKLIDKMGAKTVVHYAKKLGIESKLKAIPSVGLGSNEVSLYEMVRAYGTFLNKGKLVYPIFVKRIENNNGKILEKFHSREKRVLSKEIAWLMLYMLRGGVDEPGGTAAALYQYQLFRGNHLGGKTGTSANNSDGWFMGVSKDIVGGVWVGAMNRCVHFRDSELGEGSKTALPVFAKFMEKAYQDKNSGLDMGYFPQPDVPISQPHDCRTVLPDTAKKDTMAVSKVDSANQSMTIDSLSKDTIIAESKDTIAGMKSDSANNLKDTLKN